MKFNFVKFSYISVGIYTENNYYIYHRNVIKLLIAFCVCKARRYIWNNNKNNNNCMININT